jgi:hypothetical protein
VTASNQRYRSTVAQLRRSERKRQRQRDQVTAVIASLAAGPPPSTLPDPTNDTR